MDESIELTPGERLRILRDRRGQTLAEAAAELGCTDGTLSRIERGGRPSGPVAAAIERVYGIGAGEWYR